MFLFLSLFRFLLMYSSSYNIVFPWLGSKSFMHGSCIHACMHDHDNPWHAWGWIDHGTSSSHHFYLMYTYIYMYGHTYKSKSKLRTYHTKWNAFAALRSWFSDSTSNPWKPCRLLWFYSLLIDQAKMHFSFLLQIDILLSFPSLMKSPATFFCSLLFNPTLSTLFRMNSTDLLNEPSHFMQQKDGSNIFFFYYSIFLSYEELGKVVCSCMPFCLSMFILPRHSNGPDISRSLVCYSL